MPLLLVRVDSRLIHGQVVETWVPHTGADCLLVVNDDLAGNPALRAVMELGVPATVHAAFCRVAEVRAALSEIDAHGEKAILICATAPDAVRLRETGVPFATLNIGNLHYSSGKVEITPSVYFAPEDFQAVERLRHQGVAVDVRATPFEPGVSFDPDGG